MTSRQAKTLAKRILDISHNPGIYMSSDFYKYHYNKMSKKDRNMVDEEISNQYDPIADMMTYDIDDMPGFRG